MQKLVVARLVVFVLATIGVVIWALQGGLDEIEIHAHQTWAGSHPILFTVTLADFFGEIFFGVMRWAGSQPQNQH